MGNSLGKIVDKQTVLNTPFNQDVNNTVFYGLGLNNYNNRDSFSAGGTYSLNDYVVYPGYSTQASVLYVCILAVSPASTAPPSDPTHWELMQISTAAALGFQQPEANTVAATVQSKLQEEISIFDFLTTAQKSAVRNRTVTDVTTAFNTALSVVGAEQRELILPYGLYNVSGGLVLPTAQGWRMRGLGVYGTSIIQNANNTPIFHATGANIHSWMASGFYFGFATPQPFSNTAACGFYFDAGGNGTYQWKVENCNFDYGYAMFGNNQAASTFWYNATIDNCWCLNHVTGYFAIGVPSTSNGQPRVWFGNNYVRADSLQGAVLKMSGYESSAITLLEVNNLTDIPFLNFGGSSSFDIGCIKSESETRTAASAGQGLLLISDSYVTIGQLVHSISNLNLGANADFAQVQFGGANASCQIDVIRPGVITNTSGTVTLARATNKAATLEIGRIGALNTTELQPPFFAGQISSESGVDWLTVRQWSNGHMSFSKGDNDYTATIGDETKLLWDNPLTAARKCILPVASVTRGTANYANITGGIEFDIIRGPNATGAFNLVVYSAEDTGFTNPIATLTGAGTHARVSWVRTIGWLQV